MTSGSDDYDTRLRHAAFGFLRAKQQVRADEVLPRTDLSDFVFDGDRISLIDTTRGIRKPRQLDAALSITTAYRLDPSQRPYPDHEGSDGYMRYSWEGDDPHTYTNVGLRRAHETERPLIWFWGVGSARYQPIFPVWAVGEEAAEKRFVIAVDDTQRVLWNSTGAETNEVRRAYANRTVRTRVHQRLFRQLVLEAYDRRCALCQLRHTPLIDAAHITGDAEGGEPVVTNGIAMCAIHHRAFDGNAVGINPDGYLIEVRPDWLVERDDDGPAWRYVIQGVHGQQLRLPQRRRDHPDPERLAARYAVFRAGWA